METIQQQIIGLTQSNTLDEGLNHIFKDYIKYKLYYLKNENIRYELKWGMSFDEFEEKSPQMPNGTTYELEQEYYQWESIITELEYFSKMLNQWK